MKKLLFLLILLCLEKALHAQQPYIYTIKADSVKITNTCDTAELIIENHTQNVPGFLFNKGRGRTEFRRPLFSLNDSVYLIGGDTLDVSKAFGGKYYKQGGNGFGSAALLGTKDNYPLTFIQNGIEKGRIDTSGHWLFNTTQDRGYLAQFNGHIYNAGAIFQQKNINIIPIEGGWGDNTINIGISNSVSGNANVALGQGLQVSGGGGVLAFGVGYYNTVQNGGVGIFGSTNGGIAIGQNSYAHERSIALGVESKTTAPYQFVCGGPDHHEPEAQWANLKTDIYFGSGVQRNNVIGPGISYTINGSGAYGSDNAGGHIVIAGGKGTGTGAPGNIIFSTAVPTTSGTTLQALSEKVRIDANGNVGIGISNPSEKLHIKGNIKAEGTDGGTSYIGYIDTNFLGNTYNTFLGFVNNESYIASRYTTYGYVSKANLGNTYLEFKHGNSDWGGGGISRGLDGGNTDVYSKASSSSIDSRVRFLTKDIVRMIIDSSGKVGIGTNSPSATLHVNGTGRFDNTVTTTGHRSAIRNITGNTTITDTDEYIFASAISGAVTITLPSATGRDGQTYTIKKTDNSSNNINITTSSSQFIDGTNPYSLVNQWTFVTVVANGGNWMIVAKS